MMNTHAQSAWEAITILDEAADLLTALRLYDGRTSRDSFAEKQAILNRARERLDSVRVLA
ncbi:hypothetical protein [Azospirillum griseum]|uniref:Uncharacterized protein n=1 Tax=Azospirillum griseum TaxID=2496639 RepID=A0A431VCC2_9PROT|nr:hypothetical protein [Azospirillum griseum]RTR16556.1 hypothetical protein EJ903_20175 [Azospirillum griseum]